MNHVTIHMKCQVLFSMKNNHKKIRMWSAAVVIRALTLVMLNKLRCQAFFKFSAKQVYLIQNVDINSHTEWQTVKIQISWSQLIWIFAVCKSRVYPGSAGQGLRVKLFFFFFPENRFRHVMQIVFLDNLLDMSLQKIGFDMSCTILMHSRM